MKTRTVCIRLPEFVVEVIDKAVEEGRFKSRSDFISFSMHSM